MNSTTAGALPEIDRLISAECQATIRSEIEAVSGAEIFFVGRLDRDLVIDEVEAYAFGNARAVPALAQYARPGDVILHNHPSGNLEPSSADVDIASLVGERGVGSYIVDNRCAELRVVVKAMRPETSTPIDVEAMAATLSPGGRLAERLEGYEFRPPQIEMLRAVAEAFNSDGIAAVEADTGTGKSMAYLLPALGWAIRNREKVVIATNTINLQEQLIEKDLPLLKQTLGLEFEAVLVKGRNNYLCRRKEAYVRGHPDFALAREKREQLDSIHDWARTTRDGSRSDLGFEPDPDMWELVMSESDNCLRTKCPYYHNCYFYNARRRASRAHLLVVNHHLLMADLAVRAQTENYSYSAVLPPFHRLILDEAHHLEEVATAYLGTRFSRGGLAFVLRRLALARTGEGLLRFISTKIHDGSYPLQTEAARQWMMKLAGEYMELHREVRDAAEEAMDRAAIALDQLEGSSLDRPLELRKRLTPDFTATPAWTEEIRPPLLSIVKAARPYLEALGRLFDALHETVEKETPESMSPLLELRATARKLERQMSDIIRFLGEDDELCRWIEYRRRPSASRPIVAFCTAPIDIAPAMRERLFRRMRTVVMTSATLTVEKKFDFLLDRLGAADPEQLGLQGSTLLKEGETMPPARARPVRTLRLETPFDYDEQVYVGVPVDLPEPNDPDFARALSQFLARGLRVSRGRAFVLFTSYSLLNRVYEQIAPDLQSDGFTCLKQGEGSRTLLTETFRREVGSVLFGTSSFWEGVDIPGEALSCVVLTRLPFGVPNEPIVEARVEALRAQGADPFLRLIVPRAVIRFRQGFGRLIRRREDYGAVLICDRRVVSAHYGSMFVRSLPIGRLHSAPSDEVLEKLEAFYSSKDARLDPPSPA